MRQLGTELMRIVNATLIAVMIVIIGLIAVMIINDRHAKAELEQLDPEAGQ